MQLNNMKVKSSRLLSKVLNRLVMGGKTKWSRGAFLTNSRKNRTSSFCRKNSNKINSKIIGILLWFRMREGCKTRKRKELFSAARYHFDCEV